ncbi:MAG: class I SAM-dependent methyltransferase, partial [Rhodospirillales bacterium]|nr:class I SAM-dependent methyltransferase [Rhodospirillales bacterium]
MDARAPSRTARDAAAQRAAHQTLEGGRVFADPFARAILGGDADPLIAAAASDDSQASMRLFLAARSRFGEDALSGAVGRGARQIVVLGAGLDTFALRNPHTDARVFEVDHPATQAWKRERLAAAGLVAPPSLVFAPVDFERQSLADG